MKFRQKSSDQVSGFLDKGTNITGELQFAGNIGAFVEKPGNLIG